MRKMGNAIGAGLCLCAFLGYGYQQWLVPAARTESQNAANTAGWILISLFGALTLVFAWRTIQEKKNA
jgi:hypothetical protein